MSLKGYDYFTPDPGTIDEINCTVCGEICYVERGVNGYRSSAGAMAKIKVLHDCFCCPHSDKDWHEKALNLLQDIKKCNSPSLEKIMREDLKLLIREKDKKKIYVFEDSSERMKWFLRIFKDCEITHTEDAGTACQDIEHNEYDIIFLDRDMGHYKFSGEDIAKYMAEKKLAKDATIVIHSVNPLGQRKIKEYLDEYHDNVYQIPFTELNKMEREDFTWNDK
jgi:CheY-like chemotaxis protein